MNKTIKNLFQIEKKPHKGLLMCEWAMMVYLIVTLVMVLFSYTQLVSPDDMIFGRVRAVVITLIAWGVYRLLPCRITIALRVALQASLLTWWYTDTYELNRCLPNLDHIFAAADQALFGCQPSLLFSQACPWGWFSELMFLGYYSYFYIIGFTAILYFCYKYDEFQKTAFIILAGFFIYYIVFDFLPVVGPQFYYQAIGLDDVSRGVFPDVGNYFAHHQESMQPLGPDGGLFRNLVETGTVREGERPTAAFPSSHVGIATVAGCLLIRLCSFRRDWRLMYIYVPLYIFLCLATVYIHAHYAVDALAGFVTGVLLYFILCNIKISK